MLMQLCTSALPMFPPADLPQRAASLTAGGRKPDAEGGEANDKERESDGRTLSLSGALSSGLQDLYNFPKMKWQTCGKRSES